MSNIAFESNSLNTRGEAVEAWVERINELNQLVRKPHHFFTPSYTENPRTFERVKDNVFINQPVTDIGGPDGN